MTFKKPLADHEFGSQDTDLKLSVVETYLGAFTKAFRRKWPKLWYIDAFAGTGSRTVRVAARGGDLFDEPVPEKIEQRRGSARIAIEVQPAFDRIIFIEQSPRHCAALRALRSQYPGRDIHIIEGDANELIRKQFGLRGWQHTRAVMFLDPYGMTVDWETLKAIASTKAIDVWYLFSLSGLYRQAARRIDSIDQTKRAAITRECWGLTLGRPNCTPLLRKEISWRRSIIRQIVSAPLTCEALSFTSNGGSAKFSRKCLIRLHCRLLESRKDFRCSSRFPIRIPAQSRWRSGWPITPSKPADHPRCDLDTRGRRPSCFCHPIA
jgi:three-Cys-motif partner protein